MARMLSFLAASTNDPCAGCYPHLVKSKLIWRLLLLLLERPRDLSGTVRGYGAPVVEC